MRKIPLLIVCVFFILALSNTIKKEEEIRVRIIPNSNSKSDLNDKEYAKTIVICYLNEIYTDNYNECKENIKATINYLDMVLDNEIGQSTISFDKHTLYNKTYNNNAVKDEDYYTLYIVIGEGKGDNWWGTVYPELLEVSSSEEIKYKSFFASLLKRIKEK